MGAYGLCMIRGMETLEARFETPLKSATPKAWAAAVLRDPLGLLNDHAHLEKKAAGNALDLLLRYPAKHAPPHWVQQMTAIAREEVEHLQVVHKILDRRGAKLTKGHRNPYAAGLRDLIRRLPGEDPRGLMDRLMVSALIEVRSCERFAVLGDFLTHDAPDNLKDGELAKLYAGLWASEHGHFRTFLNLAEELPGLDAAVVAERWEEMLTAEADILAKQKPYTGMHAGYAT